MSALGAVVVVAAAAAEAGAAGAAAAGAGVGVGGETVVTGAEAASPFSHDMGRPAFNASISASVSSGRPSRFRLACSIARNELLSALLGKGGRCPRTPCPAPWGESSAICTCPLVLDPKLTHRFNCEEYSRCCQLPSIACPVFASYRIPRFSGKVGTMSCSTVSKRIWASLGRLGGCSAAPACPSL